MAIRDSDGYGAYKRLHSHCVEVVKSIKHFHGQFASTLPTVANDAIARFVPYAESLSGENLVITKGVIEEMGKALLITVTAFESELSYHLTNQSEALAPAVRSLLSIFGV